MGFGDVIANAGHILGAANDAQALRAERAYQQQVRDLALKQGVRADTGADQDFQTEQLMRQVSPVQVPGVPAVPVEGVAGPQVPQPAIPAATSPNFDERANIALQRGRPDLYAKEQAGKRALQSEGIVDLSRALISGQDPATAVQQHYNAKGSDRIDPASVAWDAKSGILTGKRTNGQDFRLDPKAALIELGVKQPNLMKIAEGETVLDPVTRQPIAYGMPKTPRYRPAAEQISIDTAKAEATAKAHEMFGKDQTPAKIKEVKFIADRIFDGDETKAVEYVYGQRDKPRSDQVLHIANTLKSDPEYAMDANARMKKAEEIVDGLRAKDRATRGGASPTNRKPPTQEPEQLSGPGMSGEPPGTKAPPQSWSDPQLGTLTFTGKTAPNGKPVYRDAKGKEYAGDFSQ